MSLSCIPQHSLSSWLPPHPVPSTGRVASPPAIQVDADGEITPEQANEEAKGWLLFVEQQWVPRAIANIPNEDGDYEVRQRRALVETWAKESQEFHDSYHQRAPLRNALDYPKEILDNSHLYYDSPSFMCLPSLGPSYRSNRSKCIKPYILSCRLDGEMDHCLDSYGSDHGGIDPDPATFPDPSTVQITDVLPSPIFEMANFEDDLDTGHITIVEFKHNGQVRESFRRRACNLWPVYLEYCTGGRALLQVKQDEVGGSDEKNSDTLDMTQPVIDILEGAKARQEFVFGVDGARDGWTEDIEIYAPGYLEMEAAGNEVDYDQARLIDTRDAYDIRARIYQGQIS